MSLALVPAGSTIKRVYYAVPSHGGIGDEFDHWDDAVKAARAKRAALIAQLTESMGRYSTPEEIERTADVQVCVDLRWEIAYPEGSGPASGTDTVIERFKDITRLRTYAESGVSR